jgi:FAD/FMN-containing dehydrogenase
MTTAGVHDNREEPLDTYLRTVRRQTIAGIICHGLFTVTLPPAASARFLEQLAVTSPEYPVAAHTLLGRFHIAVPSGSKIDAIARLSLALGGKAPFPWGFEGGLPELFSDGELAIARSLKRELDPRNILNPHLRF